MKKLKNIVGTFLCALMLVATASALEPVNAEGTAMVENIATEICESNVDSGDEMNIQNPMNEGIVSLDDETMNARLAPRDPPLTEYYVTQIKGRAWSDKDGDFIPVVETFSTQYQSMYQHAVLEATGLYDVTKPITITVYKYGNGSGVGSWSGSSCKFVTNSSPYDIIQNAYGDAVGYKIDDTYRFTDYSMTQAKLTSTATSRVSPYNKFTRDLIINFRPSTETANISE